MLKIVVDPDGVPCGLISSFTPNIGIAPEQESSITAEEAEEVVRKTFPEYSLTFYPEATRQTSVTLGEVAYHVWAVFTDYPPEEGVYEGRAYLEHLVTYDGRYLVYMAVSSPQEMELGDSVPGELAAEWFDGKEAGTYTGEVTLHDGTKETITVPVVRDPASGDWILADAERHILLSDYATFKKSFDFKTYTSKDNTGWPEHYLITYATYIKIYDFYKAYGVKSVDGFGAPILILTDYVDDWGFPIDNACFLGMNGGWALFAASAANDFGECLDVIGHEYTHGFTFCTVAGDIYENESGAVNEALSDIIGNIIEMMLGETDDTQWLLGERSGRTLRSMSFPWLYRQPARLDGTFYQETALSPSMKDDFGGVHTNSSLVNYIAWSLWAKGLSLEDSFLLWRETINLLTPHSGFRELHAALIFAADIRQLDVLWQGQIEMACEQAGF